MQEPGELFGNRTAVAKHEGKPSLSPYHNLYQVRAEDEAFGFKLFALFEDAHAIFKDRQLAMIPELPAARRARYMTELGLSAYDAGVMTAERDIADYFEAVARLSGKPKEAANWIANDVMRALSDAAVPANEVLELTIKPHQLAELIDLVAAGTIHTGAGRQVLEEMLTTGRPPAEIVAERGLEQVRDDAQIEDWCRAAIAGNEKAVSEVRAGNDKAIGALMGKVMQVSGGNADPQLVRTSLARLIAEG